MRMTAGLLAALAGLAVAATAHAPKQPRQVEVAGATITAESLYGHGSVSGPLRQGQYGLEVRMPGGTWIGCKGSCRDTLRDETVDFWEIQRNNHPGGDFSQ